MPSYWRTKWDRVMFRLDQSTLQQRLVTAYVLIILLPTILISVYIFRGLTGDTVEELRKNHENALEIEQIHIKNNMETMKRTAQLSGADFYVNPFVLEYLALPNEPSADELIDLERKLREIILRTQYNNPGIELIRIFMSSPYTYEIWPVLLHERRIVKDSWHAPVIQAEGKDVWIFSRKTRDLLPSRLSTVEINKPKISLYRELQYPKGTHVGILEIDMTLESFFPNTFNQVQDEQAQTVVIDREGNLFRHPAASFLDRSGVSEDVLRQHLLQIRTVPDGRGSFNFHVGNVPFLGVYTYIEPLEVYMLRIVALDHVFEDINRTRNIIILANIILLLILTFSTYWLNSLILKKLHVLTDSMKKVRQGDFGLNFDIRGGGEVGELAHHFRKMLRKINELIAEAVNKQAAAKEAELATLKNQIDSHFLYNTLENIKMMAEIQDQRDISDALTSLGGMLRYNMRWTSEYVHLKDELIHIANYVNIVNIRFDDKVKLVTDIPEEWLEQELLKMSLQPVVENSVKHGLGENRITVLIRAEASGDTMMISVTDDGVGMTPEQTAALNGRIVRSEARNEGTADSSGPTGAGNGIGLVNVQSRIQMHYGKEYGLLVESLLGEYTRVTLRIPHFIAREEVS